MLYVNTCVCVSRTEQNERAWSRDGLPGAGVPGGTAGREGRGTHHLLQPQRDDGFEGEQFPTHNFTTRGWKCELLLVIQTRFKVLDADQFLNLAVFRLFAPAGARRQKIRGTSIRR